MKIKKFTLVVTIAFIAAILFLTISARWIRNNFMLPNVKITRLISIQYEDIFVLENGTRVTAMRSGLAINKEIYNRIISEFGGIYVLEFREKNNETRSYVRLTSLQIKTETETDYIIDRGLLSSDFFIEESNKVLENGSEVAVIN